MTKGMFVRLPEAERRGVILLAEQESRDPRDQVRHFVREGLRRAGVLTDDRSAALTTISREPEAVAR